MSEGEMVERVARAMMKVTARLPADKLNREVPVLALDPDFDDLPRNHTEGTDEDEITQEAVYRLARAAIEAMREPTEKMLDAVWREPNVQTCEFTPGQEMDAIDFAAAWRAMIGEALKETK